MKQYTYSQLRDIRYEISREHDAATVRRLREIAQQEERSYAMHTPQSATSHKVGCSQDHI